MSTVATRDLQHRDEQHDPAPLHEQRDGVDVGRHAGDQRPAPLGVLREHRQVVHVPERPGAQRQQPALARPEQPHVDVAPSRRRRSRSPSAATPASVDDARARPGRRRREDPGVDGLLHRDRHEHAPDRRDHRQQQRDLPADQRAAGRPATPRRSVASTPSGAGGRDRWRAHRRGHAEVLHDLDGRPRPPPRRRGARSPARRRSPARGTRGRGRAARRACRGRPRGRRRRARPRRRAARTTSGRRRAARSGCAVPPSPRRPRRIACSMRGSTADVASSSTSTAGRRTSARARARRCRWPPERLAPRSPSGRVEAAGQRAHDVVDAGQAQRGPDRVVVGRSRARRRRRA